MRFVCASGVLASILGLVAAPSAADAGNVSSPLIRVYDGGAVDARMRRDALRIAAAILSASGAGATWRDCTPEGTIRPCPPHRSSRDLMIRILPKSTAGGATLGFAVVDASSETGMLATIYMDRVRLAAGRTGVDPATLLGRAMVHEVGHLLLGTTGHAEGGLMRELWTDAELRQGRPEDWVFTADERRVLRALTLRDTTVRAASSGGDAAIEIVRPAAEAGDFESAR